MHVIALHQRNLAIRQRGIVEDLQLGAAPLDHDRIRPTDLLAQFLHVVDRAMLHHHAIGRQQPQGFTGPLVVVFLRVAQLPHHAIGRVIPAPAETPDGRQRKPVVGIRTRPSP